MSFTGVLIAGIASSPVIIQHLTAPSIEDLA
jgi:hypothetical protein